MREILFRGKRKDNGKWVYGYFVQICGEGFIITKDEISWVISIGQFDISYCDVIPETVGQYTGVKDENNKRIFEGDIIEYRDDMGKIMGKGIIEYDYKNGGYEVIRLNLNYYPMVLSSCCRIVGNKWDDPELLEK